MAEQLLICRCCHKRDIDKSKPETYVNPSRGWYYHTDCYNDFINKKDNVMATAENDEWKDLLWDYLARDVKLPGLNYNKFDAQWQSFMFKQKKKMTAKGLFFACRYFYEVIHGNKDEAQGGIGILPYVYDDSCVYWKNRANMNTSVCQKIEEQIVQKEQREVKIVTQRQTRKSKPQVSLADIMALEEDE